MIASAASSAVTPLTPAMINNSSRSGRLQKRTVRPMLCSWRYVRGPIGSAGCLRCRSSTVGSPGSPSATMTLPSPDVSQVEPYTSSKLWIRLLPLAALRSWCSNMSSTPRAITSCQEELSAEPILSSETPAPDPLPRPRSSRRSGTSARRSPQTGLGPWSGRWAMARATPQAARSAVADPRLTGGFQLETAAALWKQRLARHIARSTDSSGNETFNERQAANTALSRGSGVGITIGLLVRWPAALLRLPMVADLFVRVLQGAQAEWSLRPPRTCRTASPSPP
jgi:hypothetical protein